MKTAGHVIGSKRGNKNRAESYSQCAGRDSKKIAELLLCVDETLTAQWSEETPSKKKKKKETLIFRE